MEEAPDSQRITALIISRNCAGALRHCLEALNHSDERESLEILVVDSGSRDGTADVPDELPSVTTLKLPKHFGRTKALNIGIRTAKSDFILLMDPQIEVAPDALSRLKARLAHDETVGAVCPYVATAYAIPSAADLATAWKSGNLPGGRPVDPNAAEIAVDYPKGAPVMVRRTFLKGMNYFDERFGDHWPDLELFWQLRNAGKRILVLPGARVNLSPEPHRIPGAIDSADCAVGAAAYVAKHYGWAAGLKFRLAASLYILRKLLTLRNIGYEARRLSAVLSGQKIDGTQS